jgi:16S rRNA (adenine1518-N6/adenine1519-N6)-dimethyltransferase
MSTRPRARKRFGQHFLEAAWVRKLVEVLEPAVSDTFLEIGPGSGALTRPLAESVARVLAVEIDRDLSARLAAQSPANVTVVTGDFLEIDVLPILLGLLPQASARQVATRGAPASAGAGTPGRVRVVGNLPYNASSPMLFRLLDLQKERGIFADATLMVQREIADRITAAPGRREYGILSVFVQLQADARRLLVLPPGAFRPVPRVWSALVHLAFRPPPVSIADPDLFAGMVRRLFRQRRKTVLNALRPFAAPFGASPEAALAAAGVRATRRPESLQLTEFARLAAYFSSARSGSVL